MRMRNFSSPSQIETLQLHNSSREMVHLVLFTVQLLLHYGGSTAPGDSIEFCRNIREAGVVPMLFYPTNLRVLMDSWNYKNLLSSHHSERLGSVWQQADYDKNNHITTTTNVSQSYRI